MKKPQRSSDVVVSGVSAEASKNALKKVSEMKVGQSMILPTAGQELEYQLIKVPAGEVAKRTKVNADENDRFQSSLNRISLMDILETLEEGGQGYPARGYIDDKGVIHVWDGSRRRMACILAGKDYYILVTKTKIDKDSIRAISRTGNVQKPLSLYEKGMRWDALLVDGKYETAAQLAAGEREDPAIVTAARKAFSLPKSIIEMIPDIYSLGRPSINRIFTAVKGMEEEEITKTISKVKIDSLDNLINEHGTNGTVLNAVFLKALFEAFPAPSKKKPKEHKPELQERIETLEIPRSFKRVPVAGSGKIEVVMAEEGDFALIELAHVDNKTREDIYSYIRQKIEG